MISFDARYAIKDFHLKSEDRISMVDIRVNWRLAVYTADHGPLGHPAGVQFTRRAATAVGSQPRWLPRAAFRFVRSWMARVIRPYYVAGYAGASYGPGLFSPPEHGRLTDGPGPGRHPM